VIDLTTLRKLETPSPSELARGRNDTDRITVLVRLHEGAELPSYITMRAEISAEIITGEISGADLERIDSDPAIASVAFSARTR